jgi:protein-tyrosine phosphatase
MAYYPQLGTTKMSSNPDLLVRLVIYHPLPENQVLAVIGGCPALENWQQPKVMTLGAERRLLSGGWGKCWEYLLKAPKSQLAGVEYRYLIKNRITGSTIWEREPNRVLNLSEVDSNDIEVMDANFVSGMQFDAVSAALFLGPYPQLPEDIDALKRQGISAVLNVQTDADIALRYVDFEAFRIHYRKAAIDLHHLPIEDFNEVDLMAKLPAAVGLLKELLDANHRVYVHCTAGMGRSAAVAVAYLSLYHGQSLDKALAYVKDCRPVICPNVSAIRHFLETVSSSLTP